MEIKKLEQNFSVRQAVEARAYKARYRYGAVSLIIALAAAGIVVLLGKL